MFQIEVLQSDNLKNITMNAVNTNTILSIILTPGRISNAMF